MPPSPTVATAAASMSSIVCSGPIRGLTRVDVAVRDGEGVRVEAGQVGEAPGLHGRVRKREGLVALEERGATTHVGRSGGAA